MPGRIQSPQRGIYRPANYGPPPRPFSPHRRERPLSPKLYQIRQLSPDIHRARRMSPVYHRGRAPSPEFYRNRRPLSPRHGDRPLSPGFHRGPREHRSRPPHRTRQRQYTEQVGQIDFGDEDSIANDANEQIERLYSSGGVRDDFNRHPQHARVHERILNNDFAYIGRPRDLSPRAYRDFSPRPHRDFSPRPHRDFSPRPRQAFSPGRQKERERFIQERGLSPRRERHFSPPRREPPPKRQENLSEDLNNGIYGPPVPVSNPEPVQNRRIQNGHRIAFSSPPQIQQNPLINQNYYQPPNQVIRPIYGQMGPHPGVIRPPPHILGPPPHGMGPTAGLGPHNGYISHPVLPGPPPSYPGPPAMVGPIYGFP